MWGHCSSAFSSQFTMASILDRLREQEEAMSKSGQSSQGAREYLSSVNPQLQSPNSRPVSSLSKGALVAVDSSQPAAASTQPSPSRSTYTVAEANKTALVECPSPTAVKGGELANVDTHPATGYPPTEGAYMNNLPQDLYSPKVFLPKHVTEALELCVAVLERHTSNRGHLSAQDEQLIDQISAYKGRNVSAYRRIQIAPKAEEGTPTKGLIDIQTDDGAMVVAPL